MSSRPACRTRHAAHGGTARPGRVSAPADSDAARSGRRRFYFLRCGGRRDAAPEGARPAQPPAVWDREGRINLNNPKKKESKNENQDDIYEDSSLKLLRTPSSSHPFYWAGFVVVGNGW